MKLFHKESKQKKETRSLPMGKKSRSAFAVYAALVLMPVSYTHLDVYKRQGERPLIPLLKGWRFSWKDCFSPLDFCWAVWSAC